MIGNCQHHPGVAFDSETHLQLGPLRRIFDRVVQDVQDRGTQVRRVTDHGEFLGIVAGYIKAGYLEDFYHAVSTYEGEAVSLFRRDGTVRPAQHIGSGGPIDIAKKCKDRGAENRDADQRQLERR